VVCITESSRPTFLHLLRSYPCREEEAPPCTILQAACAAIASRSHFDPVTIGEGYNEVELRSGLVGYANPTSELLKEAARVFGGDCWAATLVSLGEKPIFPSNDVTDIQRLEAVITDGNPVHQDLYHRLHQLNMYFRFDVPHQTTTNLNDTQSVYRKVQEYKSDGRISELINEAVRSIHVRQQVKMLSELSENCIPSLIQSNKNTSLRKSGGSRTQAETIVSAILRRTTGHSGFSSFGTYQRLSVAIRWSDYQRTSWARWIGEDTNITKACT
jgi:hypothetical protein